MAERRGSKRSALASRVIIKQLGGSGNTDIEIRITDVSKTGIGFLAGEPLEIGEIYESYLTVWREDVVHTYLQIIRTEPVGNEYAYGAVFIGMSEKDAERIEWYQSLYEEIET